MRIRLQRFVGEHPVLVVNLATVAACLGGAALFLATDWLVPNSWIRTVGKLPFVLSIFGIPALFLLVAVMMTAFVLGRAGLTSANILGGLKYVPLWIAAMSVLMEVADAVYKYIAYAIPWSPERADVSVLLIGWTMVSLLVMVWHALGWGAAALVIRYKTRQGKWEYTEPVEPPKGAPMILPRVKRWIAKNPAANVAALAVPCTPAVALGAACLVAMVFYDPPNLLVPLLIVLAGVAALVLMTAWAAFVGCVMGRAGMSTQDAAWRAAAGAILMAVALGAVAGVALGFLGGTSQWPAGWVGLSAALALAGCAVALPQAVCIWLGFHLAERMVRRRVQSGRWEVTRSTKPGEPKR